MSRTLLVAFLWCGCALEDDRLDPVVSVEDSPITTPEVGYYCSILYPSGGWQLFSGSGHTPCANMSSGGEVRRTGMFSATGPNHVRVQCTMPSSTYSASFAGVGSAPITAAFNAVSDGKSGCEFTVTMSSSASRTDPPNVTPGCADATVEQNFGVVTDPDGTKRQIVGCAGHVSYAVRGALCAAGWTPASAATFARLPSPSPTHNYWTADNLRYSGNSISCSVSPSVGNTCGSGAMSVCTPSGTDAEGNSCVWKGCTLSGTSVSAFGGCSTWAGTICERVTPPPTTQVSNYVSFDPQGFTDDMKTYLDARLPAPDDWGGYQFVMLDVNGNVVTDIVGGHQKPIVGLNPPVDMTHGARIDIASNSKVVTAIAIVAAMEDLNRRGIAVGLDSSIAAYLPSTWSLSPIVKNLTFRHLLRHRSGFVGGCNGGELAALRTYVEAGPDVTKINSWNYSSCGYQILRVLLAYLVDGPAAYQPHEANSEVLGRLTAASHRAYVRGRLFAPLGFGTADILDNTTSPVKYFTPNSIALCTDPTPYEPAILRAGPGWWAISAMEMTKLLSALRGGRIVSPQSYTSMTASNLDGDVIGMGRQTVSPLGFFYMSAGGSCANSFTTIYPNGMSSTLITNTKDINLAFDPMRDAYRDNCTY